MKKVLCVVLLFFASFLANANSIVDQWKSGLAGSRLTSYSGSAISSNSTLTIINFCRNGRYSYYKEGSWSVPGTAGGASNNTVTGIWDVQSLNSITYLTYKTDRGEQGAFPIYLQANGRVNIGGAAYAVERGKSGC
ncbi:hypothetical protein ACFOEK_20090 [Litoribrevibacter euphylliae]|uniref:Uncharacterized protein n=1 Tax=Litoribrevibacter euphylliae TaxID=1834034 RepID=A0ABV7HNW0_9GAMM